MDIVGIITTPVSFSRVTARHLTSNMHQLDRVDFTVHWCVEMQTRPGISTGKRGKILTLEAGYDLDNDVVLFRRMAGNILSALVVRFDL